MTTGVVTKVVVNYGVPGAAGATGSKGDTGASGAGGVAIAPVEDSNTLCAWRFTETSGTTIHNYGTVGDSSSTQLNIQNSSYVLSVTHALRLCMGFYGACAQGGATIQPTGSFFIGCVITPSKVAAFTSLFGKARLAPNNWSAPFKAFALSINADGTVSAEVNRADTNYSVSTPNVVEIGKLNFLITGWDSVNGILSLGLNGYPLVTRSGLAAGDVYYGSNPNGNWYFGETPVSSDIFYGQAHYAFIQNGLLTQSYCTTAYKKLTGAIW